MKKNIKKIRLDRKLRQDELAKMVGVSTVTMGRFERDERQPRADTLVKIAQALNCKVDDLLQNTQQLRGATE